MFDELSIVYLFAIIHKVLSNSVINELILGQYSHYEI